MCFGGKGTGGHQGGNANAEDGAIRKQFREEGKTAREARSYFRDRDSGKLAADAYLATEVGSGKISSVAPEDGGGDVTYGDVLKSQLREKGLNLEGQSFIKYDDEGRRSTAGGINARGNIWGPDLGNLPSPNRLSQIARTGSRDSKYGVNQQAFDEGTLDPKIEKSLFDGVTYTPMGTVGMGNRVVYDKNAQYPGESGLSFNPKTGRFDYDPKIGYTEDYPSIAGKIARTVGPALVANAMGPLAPAAGAMIAYNNYKNKRPGVFSGILNKVLGRDEAETDLAIGALPNRPILRPSSMNVSTLADANKGETIMVDGVPKQYAKKVPISNYFRMNDPLGNDNNDNFDQVMPPVGEGSGEEQSIYDRFNYRKWLASNPTLIGQSSYGGKFGSGQPSYMASVLPSGIYSDGMAGSTVLTPFFNPTTGEYFNAPASNYYAEEGSNWRKGSPTEAYNLPIVA
mgnify:CR=1 FL=1